MSVGWSDRQCSIAAWGSKESKALGRCSDFTFGICHYELVVYVAKIAHHLTSIVSTEYGIVLTIMVACSIFYINREVVMLIRPLT